MAGVYPRIRSIHLTRWERPKRALIWTKYGMVRVVWRNVGRKSCRFSTGKPKAKEEALPAIEHIEQMCQSMH